MERPPKDRTRCQPEDAEHDQQDRDDGGQRFDDRPIADPHAVHVNELVAQLVCRRGEALGLVICSTESFDGEGSVDVFMSDSADLASLMLHFHERI